MWGCAPSDNPEQSADSGDGQQQQPERDVYFHTLHSHNDWNDEPWGYFSFDRTPDPDVVPGDADTTPMEEIEVLEYDRALRKIGTFGLFSMFIKAHCSIMFCEGEDEESGDAKSEDAFVVHAYLKEFKSTKKEIRGFTR